MPGHAFDNKKGKYDETSMTQKKANKKKNKDKMSVISTTIAKNYRDCELPWQQQQKQVVIKNLQILFAFVYII